MNCKTLKTLLVGAALAVVATLPATGAMAACSFTRVAELPLTLRDLRAVVHAKVNGQEADFLLDTGAFYSVITPQAAARLKLSMAPAAAGFAMVGVGGETSVRIGTAREITFAGAPVKGMKFIVGGQELDHDVVGVIGQNFLKNADVEYDLANGVVRLFVAKDCAGVGLAYWKGVSADVIPLTKTEENDAHILGKAAINGRVVDVVFDTGAPTSFVSIDAARRIGLPLDGPNVQAGGVTGGFGRGLVESWIVPVSSFQIGAETIQRTRLTVGNSRRVGGDMLLGADFFLSHRVMVANSQRRLYFTYNGGPVFSLGRPNAGAAVAATDRGADDAKMSADALARRAGASISRRNYRAAIADLTRAIAMEPRNARYLADRGHARMYSDDVKGAREDYDAALALNAVDKDALVNRGYLRMEAGDLGGAKADLVSAISAAPDDLNTVQKVAGVYERGEHYEQAVAAYDGWIAAHPRNSDLWQALNGRCWVRAMWNHDLDKALEDCDGAVKRGQRNSEALDSRGMAHLRLGQYQLAVADYDAAIKQQARSAWSYVGRGLAREKLGDKAGAEADIKQALALSPGAARRARKVGFDSALLPKGGAGTKGHDKADADDDDSNAKT